MGFTLTATPCQAQHQQSSVVRPNTKTPTSNPLIKSSVSSSTPKPNHNNQISRIQIRKQIDPIISWTSAIARHCQKGNLSSAIKTLTQMRFSDVHPNHITFITLISAISNQTPHHLPASLHGYIHKLGLLNTPADVKLGTALLHMYSKRGRLGFARQVFDKLYYKNSVTWNTMIDAYIRNRSIADALQLFEEMPVSLRDTVSWTVLINGFVKEGVYDSALECFCEMQLSGVHPDFVTVIAVVSACANLGALSLGLWVNRFVLGKDFKGNVRLCNSLIDMYSRCGRVDYARQVFESMPCRSLVSWNSMIGGFAANGCVAEALQTFDKMQREGFKPDGVSFTGALTACSHAGLVDQGLKYFDEMQSFYDLLPRIEHYGCLVDLYSRAGRIGDAFNVIKSMPMKPNEVVLGSLLAACRNCGDIELAEMVMKYLVEVDPASDSNYVMLANMYAAIGSWEGAGKVRRKMKTTGRQKKPGISSIEIDGCINEFVAADRSHSETDSIYEILELLSCELRLYE